MLGFLITVALHETSEQDRIKDPAVRAAWRTIQNRAPLRSGEGALYFRFWMAAETYQAVSPLQSLIFVDVVRTYLTTRDWHSPCLLALIPISGLPS